MLISDWQTEIVGTLFLEEILIPEQFPSKFVSKLRKGQNFKFINLMKEQSSLKILQFWIAYFLQKKYTHIQLLNCIL